MLEEFEMSGIKESEINGAEIKGAELKTAQFTSAQTYDETPYESYPYQQTRPELLKAITHMFGLETPDIETASILELGSASGGNLITHAINYPKAKFVGVDISKVQVKEGNDKIKQLGLKNIELKEISITDITKSFGKFDYIICHGVISWVPEEVRNAIFRISNENLSEKGVAIISYNTLPGWNAVRTIRDMMLFHSSKFSDIKEQVQQSRLLLNFVRDSLDGADNPYGEIMKAEAQILNSQPDHYLRHDHMEDVNFQYYFHDFMKEADKHNLQYVGDASVASMYSGNLPKPIAEKLAEVKDIIRAEQYMDFVLNRRFRSTILCHKNIQLNRNITGNSMDKLYFSTKITPEKAIDLVNIDSNDSLEFYYMGNKDNKLNTTHPTLKALLYTFFETGNYALSPKELAVKIKEKLPKQKISDDQIMVDIMSNITRLVFSGYLNIASKRVEFHSKPSKQPKLWDLARAQIEAKQNWVSSMIHEKITLSPLDFFILKHLDGKHSYEQLIDELLKHIENKEITVNQNDKPVTDLKAAKEILKPYLEHSLNAYAANALLV